MTPAALGGKPSAPAPFACVSSSRVSDAARPLPPVSPPSGGLLRSCSGSGRGVPPGPPTPTPGAPPRSICSGPTNRPGTVPGGRRPEAAHTPARAGEAGDRGLKELGAGPGAPGTVTRSCGSPSRRHTSHGRSAPRCPSHTPAKCACQSGSPEATDNTVPPLRGSRLGGIGGDGRGRHRAGGVLGCWASLSGPHMGWGPGLLVAGPGGLCCAACRPGRSAGHRGVRAAEGGWAGHRGALAHSPGPSVHTSPASGLHLCRGDRCLVW